MAALLHDRDADNSQNEQQLGTDAPQLSTQVPHIDWSSTPELILTDIFRMLPVLDRMNMSQVCSAWLKASSNPLIWRHFDYGVVHPEGTPTDVENMIAQLRSNHKQYLSIIQDYGEKFSQVHIVLYCQESFDVLLYLADYCDTNNLKCSIVERYDSSVHLPPDFKRTLCLFLTSNADVQEIYFRNIYFEGDTQNSSIPIGPANARCLRKLSFVNSFQDNSLCSLMYLVNLTELTIFPPHIQCAWLSCLAKASLRTLNIVGKSGMWEFDFHNLPESTWRQITKSSAKLTVNCYLMDLCSKVVCPGMPLATFVCCEYFSLEFSRILMLLTPFAETLSTFVDFSLVERSYQFKPLVADDDIIKIIQKCSKLTTLAVKNCLHSSTILLIVQLNPNLKDPIIRDDMIQYDLYIPESIRLTQQVQTYTEENFSKDKFATAMSCLLKREWCPLPPEEYFQVLKSKYCIW